MVPRCIGDQAGLISAFVTRVTVRDGCAGGMRYGRAGFVRSGVEVERAATGDVQRVRRGRAHLDVYMDSDRGARFACLVRIAHTVLVGAGTPRRRPGGI